MTLERLAAVAASVWVAVLTGVTLAGLVERDFEVRIRNLDLTAPERLVVDTEAIGESSLGLFRWRAGRPLGVRIGRLERGDLLKLKLRSECPPTTVVLTLDGEQAAELVIDDRWRQLEVTVPIGGSVLGLQRSEASPPCDLHVSRIFSTNLRAYSSGLVELYAVLETRPSPVLPRAAVWGLLLLPVAWLLLRARGRPAPGWPRSVLVVASGALLLALLQLMAAAGGLRIVVPPRGFVVLVVGLPALLWLLPKVWPTVWQRIVAGVGWARRRPWPVWAICLVGGTSVWISILSGIAAENWDSDLRGFPRFDRRFARSPVLADVPKQSWGHDGQFYATLATDPFLRLEGTVRSLDTPAYRARRVLVPFVAWCLSLGEPNRAVQIYVLLCWLSTLAGVALAGSDHVRRGGSPLLAILLLFQAGVVVTVERATPDGAAAALVVLALFAWERRRRAATILGCVGSVGATLAKESSIVVAPALALDAWRSGRRWGAALLVALPGLALAGWLAWVGKQVGFKALLGHDNFKLPFVWLVPKLVQLQENEWSRALLWAEIGSVASLLLAAALVIRLLPRWRTLTALELTFTATIGLAAILSMKVYAAIFDYSRVLVAIPLLALMIASRREERSVRWLAAAVVVLGAGSGLSLLGAVL